MGVVKSQNIVIKDKKRELGGGGVAQKDTKEIDAGA